MNKKKVITILVLILTFSYIKGQDKIITIQNDTIFCKILSISSTYIKYKEKDDNWKTVGKFCPIKHVKEYYRESDGKQYKEPFNRWRIGIQGGGAYLLASSDKSKTDMQKMGVPKSQADEYHSRLRNGLSADADVHYFIFSFFGIGLKYSLFTTSVNIDLNYKDNNLDLPVYYTVGEKDNIYVNYIGPSVVFQQWLDKNHKFKISEELSLGYTHYREEIRYNPYKYIFDIMSSQRYNLLAEGNTLGGKTQVSFEYYPLSWMSLNVNTGLFTAIFNKVKISSKNMSVENKLDKDNYLNMSHLDYSIGIRFHF